MKPLVYEVRWSKEAKDMLSAIRDRRVRQKLVERAESLAADPHLQGKPMGRELAGCRSVRAVGQRYRIIYKIESKQVVVFVIALGIRKENDKADVCRLAKKLVDFGLIDFTKEQSPDFQKMC